MSFLHITQASVFSPFDRAATFPMVTRATAFPCGTLAELASAKAWVMPTRRHNRHTCVMARPLFPILREVAMGRNTNGARGKY